MGTVVDDDPAPALSIAAAEVEEGSISLTDVALQVTMSRPSSRDVVARYATTDGSATAGQEHAAVDAELLIAAGKTSADAHVAVSGGEAVEPHETFTLSLSDPQHATIATPDAEVRIVDDEPVVVTVTADDGTNSPVSVQASVTVDNVTPSIDAAGYVDGSLTVTFTDPGDDTHRCVIDPGDGTPAIATDPATSPCTAAHPYPPGSYEATVTVTDDEGGSASTTVPVTVQAPTEYEWDGFFQPVSNDAVNQVQAGRAIPMKFSLGGTSDSTSSPMARRPRSASNATPERRWRSSRRRSRPGAAA